MYNIITADLKFHAPYTHRIILLCLEKNIPYTLTTINLQDKPAWFIEIAPSGEVPVLKVADEIIHDSYNIAKYLDNLSHPQYIPDKHASTYGAFIEILSKINTLGKNLVMFFRNQQFAITNVRTLYNDLVKLELYLNKPYLLGEEISYADFALLPHILQIECMDEHMFPFKLLAKFPKLQEWLKIMQKRPSVTQSSVNFAEGFIEHIKARGFYEELIK